MAALPQQLYFWVLVSALLACHGEGQQQIQQLTDGTFKNNGKVEAAKQHRFQQTPPVFSPKTAAVPLTAAMTSSQGYKTSSTEDLGLAELQERVFALDKAAAQARQDLVNKLMQTEAITATVRNSLRTQLVHIARAAGKVRNRLTPEERVKEADDKQHLLLNKTESAQSKTDGSQNAPLPSFLDAIKVASVIRPSSNTNSSDQTSMAFRETEPWGGPLTGSNSDEAFANRYQLMT